MMIKKYRLAFVVGALMASTSALAEPVKTEAVVTSISGNTITARTIDGTLSVVLTPATKISQTAGSPRGTAGTSRA